MKGKGEFVEADDRRRDHVARQPLREEAPQRRRGHRAHLGCHIADQTALTGRILPRQHQRLAYRGMLLQRRLHLSGFDPVAAHLHLLVDPVEELQPPVRQLAHEVTRSVQHATLRPGERVGYERLGRRRGLAQIPPGKGVAAEQKFPGGTRVDQSELRVHHEQVHAGDRVAERENAVLGHPTRRDRPVGGRRGALGRPVHVHEWDPQTLPLNDSLRQHPVPAHDDPPQRRRERTCRLDQVGHEEVPLGRLQLQQCDRPGLDDVEECMHRRQRGPIRGEHARRTMDQRREHLLQRRGEGCRGQHEVTVRRPDGQLRIRGEGQVGQTTVRDHHTFGNPGRARGVDDAGKIVRGDLVGADAVRSRTPVGLDHRHGPAYRRIPAVRSGDERHDAGIRGKEVFSRVRVIRVDRHVDPARAQDGQHRDQKIAGVAHQDAHPVLHAHAYLDQPVGQAVDAPDKLCVGNRTRCVLRRDGGGRRRCGALQ